MRTQNPKTDPHRHAQQSSRCKAGQWSKDNLSTMMQEQTGIHRYNNNNKAEPLTESKTLYNNKLIDHRCKVMKNLEKNIEESVGLAEEFLDWTPKV